MANEFYVSWNDDARADLMYWLEHDNNVAKKIHKLIEEAVRLKKNGDNPLGGTGQPEFLKGNLSGCVSRRISQKERLIYKLYDNGLLIVACRGHYGNK